MIAQEGYAHASLRKVAQHAGCTTGTERCRTTSPRPGRTG
ncbi:hypothetical protein ACWGDS_03240 [Streptomyces sp. NPDC055059]